MLRDDALRAPRTLRGPLLRLEPLELRHAAPLAGIAKDPRIFQYLSYRPAGSVDQMTELVGELLERHAAGTDLPFVIVAERNGAPLGMTRYLSIDRPNAAVEVGGTWMPPELWGSPVNAASKRLMLGHAFDDEGVHRVQIKTDQRNVRSQRAIEKLGALREGVLREDRIMPDGFLRSSVVYSLLAPEWPAARDRLDARLAGASLPERLPAPP